MKVILFCGGLGTRLREHSETLPKPMVEIGYRPIIWHLMKYYAHFGHKDFILCLGYKGDVIKNYFLNYDECISNDFVMSKGGKEVRIYNSDISDWTITFAETGLNSNIGQRFLAAKKYLRDDDVFMANYSDGLVDLDLDKYMDHFYKMDKVASFISVKPTQYFHIVTSENDMVSEIIPIAKADVWVNGGFFIFKKSIFDYIHEGEELVMEPFNRLIEKKQLITYQHTGFFACMDTLKEKQMLDDMYANGAMPWDLSNSTGNHSAGPKIIDVNCAQEKQNMAIQEMLPLHDRNHIHGVNR